MPSTRRTGVSGQGRVNRKRLVDDLQRLVDIPSYLECDTIARYVLRSLKEAGVTGRIDKAGNVVAELGSGGPGLLLNAHLDTVPPPEGQLRARRVGDKIIGRGSTDDKSGVAAMLELARILNSSPLKQRVTLGFTVWEESTGQGENGSYHLAGTCKAARAIVLEGTTDATKAAMGVHVGCKGILRLDIMVKGKSYHAGQPHKGINAVSRAAKVIEAFEEIFEPSTMPARTYRVGRRDVAMTELATITEIEARQGANVIPGACRIVANCRLLPDGNHGEILSRMKQLSARLPRGWITWQASRLIPGHICQDTQLVEACRQAISGVGLRAGTDISAGRTDSTIFQNFGGVQAVVMGPGLTGTPHTDGEYASADKMVAGTAAVLAAVEQLVC